MRDRGLRVPTMLLRDGDRFVRRVADTLGRGDTVIDLGAHVGRVAQEFAHRAGRVHAFEPHPDTFRELCRNTRNYPRVTPLNIAASDRTGTERLYFNRPAAGRFTEGATLIRDKSNVADAAGLAVQTVRLAEFVAGLGTDIALIKMDVEGAEYRILADLVENSVMARIGKVWVEDHCDRIPGLAAERARVEARIDALGLADRFDFTWP